MPRPLRILIACPAKPGTRYGNRVTALRWQSIFHELGHLARIDFQLRGEYDVLVALHAFRSSSLIAESRQTRPATPIVVAITGTDLYRDGKSRATLDSLELADRLVVLQPSAIDDLPAKYRSKTQVIYQSVRPLQLLRPQHPRSKRVLVAGHLRREKDPMRAAMAVRRLPPESRICVHHFGAEIDAGLAQQARAEAATNPRYRWMGEVPRGHLKRHLATCWLMVLSSRMEGGANVLSEAIAQRTPVLASRIPGSIGLLGEDYVGYFAVGKTTELRQLLIRCEQDASFYEALVNQVAARSELFTRARELRSWKSLLSNLPFGT